MQVWLVVGGWLFAVLFAVVLLGFAGYELAWKTRRLAADRAKLDGTVAELTQLAAQLQAVAERAAALRPARDAGPAAGSVLAAGSVPAIGSAPAAGSVPAIGSVPAAGSGPATVAGSVPATSEPISP